MNRKITTFDFGFHYEHYLAGSTFVLSGNEVCIMLKASVNGLPLSLAISSAVVGGVCADMDITFTDVNFPNHLIKTLSTLKCGNQDIFLLCP